MDDQQPTTPTPGAGQVMDIATPGPQVIEPTVANQPDQPAVQAPAFSAVSPEPVAVAPQTPSLPTETASPAEPSPGGLTMTSSSEPVHEAPATPGEIKPEVPKTSHGGHHTGAPVAAIVIAVVVAVALAGVVIFSYMKARDNGAINRSDSTNTDTVAEKPQASVADVDAATSEIDSSLEAADDSTDFATTDLSDTTLGL